ncbi:hypothetical protein RhiirC2_747459, partial [Rhizophagus irregularis]
MNENHAIFNNSFCGPTFGKNDFCIWPGFMVNVCRKASYEKPIRETTGNFNVEEC